MTEAEWLAATDLKPMLEFLKEKASDRKLRLAGCALCRHLWELFPDLGNRPVIDVVERYADGSATQKELTSARRRATRISGVAAENEDEDIYTTTVAVKLLCAHDGLKEGGVAVGVYWALHAEAESDTEGVLRERLASVLHCVFGNPFRPVTLNPSWLTPTALALATGIYHEKAFDRMPILADALQDAGCDNEDILNHCRQSGEHTKGCWALDLILGKQ